MTDPFRGGGFGSVGMGPFQTGGGDFSRYNIANDGNDVALTKKYSAQLAWANGTITDDAYLGALAAYVRTTDKGSRDRIGAQNEYDDAVYTIGRNKIVRSVNQAASSVMRVAALRRLIGYDRRKLGTMTGDNEQARELRDRIAESEASVREVRYSDLVRRFNANAVSLSAMLSYARNAAAGSRGGPDHETWLGRITEWSDRAANEKLNGLYQDYEHERIPGSTIIDFLQGRLGEMSPDSPQYAETQRTIEDLTKRITADDIAKRDADMAERVARGTVSQNEYLNYLHKRVQDYPKGSSDRRSAETQWLNAAFEAGEQNLLQKLDQGSVETQEVVDFYRNYMTSMDPSSARFLEIQQRVTNLLVSGTSSMTLFDSKVGGYAGGGHWVSLTGAPGGTPVNGAGFASQFDGSAFGSSNCGMASAAMMAWAVSGGKVKVSGGDLRYYSGDRDQTGDEKGTTYDDIALAYQNVGLGLKQYHGMGFNDWKRRLLAGEGSLISGHYMDAPANLRKTNSASFTHTMYVDRARKVDGRVWFFVMDPLGRGDYTGQWWPEEAIKQYGWSGRANAGGGQWMGDVAFATKKGRSGTYISPDRQPPRFQAFDTDADGKSTVGRGGGTNRQEAGRRQDWSKGKAAVAPTSWPQYTLPTDGKVHEAKPDPSAITDEQVGEFLAAVDSVSKPSISDPTTWGARAQPGFESAREQDRRAKAKALLGEWGGDARLAAVAWFTGSVTPDTAAWDKTQRFYANAIGGRLGYQPVPRGGSSIQTPTGQVNVPLTPMRPPSPLDLNTTPQPRFDQQDDLTDDQRNVARMLLEKLGIEPTPNMMRAVAAWIATEGATVKGNNPLGLHTTGTADLPGQLGKDADGAAVFGSLEEGVAAAADELARSNPEVLAAARTLDPERFLVSLDRSGWAEGGYNGTLIRTYNELPGPHPHIIGGYPGLLKASGTLADVARSIPSVAEIFDIDPRDPIQMAWLQSNIDSAKTALAGGASTWTFRTNGGVSVQVDLAPEMVGEMTYAKAAYLDHMSKSNPTDDKLASQATDALRDHITGVVRVSADEWEQTYDALDRLRTIALGKGDAGLATYLNATFQMADATKLFLGLDPAGPLDIGQANITEYLTDSIKTKVTNAIDQIDVRDTSGDLNTYNPAGDPVLGAWQKGYIQVVKDKDGNVAGGMADPNMAYWRWGDGGTPQFRSIDTHPDDFKVATIVDAKTGQDVSVPAYLQDTVAFTIGGMTARTVPEAAEMTAVVLTSGDYRKTIIPEPPAMGAAAGSLTSISTNVGGVDPFAGTFKSPPGSGGTANVSPWLMQGTPRGRLVNVTTPDDRMAETAKVRVPVGLIHLKNPQTGEMESWWSVEGSGQWLGGPDDLGGKNPPRLVLGNGADIKNGQLLINGDAYDPDKHGALSRYSHWYGTDPADNAGLSMGAPDTRWKLRQAMFTEGGSSAIDTSARVNDPVQAYLEGDASFEELIARNQPRTATAQSRFQKDDLVSASPAAIADKNLSVLQQASGTTGVVNFDRISQGLADAGLWSGQVPMTAGSAASKPPSMTSMPQPTGFGIKLASGVRAAADAAALAAKQVQAAAAQRAAAEKLAAAKAAQQAAQQKAAQVQASIAPRITPTPTPTLKPRPTPTPPGLGQNPVTLPGPKGPQVTPKPTTTPPSDGRTRVLDGGV